MQHDQAQRPPTTLARSPAGTACRDSGVADPADSNTNPDAGRYTENRDRRITTETKSSKKTTELIAYVVAVVGVLAAAAITDTSDFGTQESWFYVTLLTIGYMISRGLAKSGSRDFYDDDVDANNSNR